MLNVISWFENKKKKLIESKYSDSGIKRLWKYLFFNESLETIWKQRSTLYCDQWDDDHPRSTTIPRNTNDFLFVNDELRQSQKLRNT